MATANPHQVGNIQWRENSRKKKERFIEGQHVSLDELSEQNVMIKYLGKKIFIPPYPTPVEFWVKDVAHVTNKSGFMAILESELFGPPNSKFSWWDLKINEEEIRAAEARYMQRNFPNQAQEPNEEEPFLEKFTTSPQFQLKTSRYGNYRFTFPLTELMQEYKEQNCGGAEPVLRVYETITYSQEIVYAVLIHSPEDNQRFRIYPLLETSDWVRYNDGKIIWKAQAICETHEFKFNSCEERIQSRAEKQSDFEYYVWDHVSLLFHLPNDASIKIPRRRLIKALDACKLDEIDLSGYQGTKTNEERFLEAETIVGGLKRDLEGFGELL
ncbi:uncharacterized protein DAT39_013648 [Clarias magur]|uniref:Uncharacterized protein n=1 Tax=Clarias magur TaxID=1594786 RepID=A0A8J4WYB5_CLAMG|nr:uncharacterized protein DAT39_013648 [Clarias magur]